jgi:anti-anti-sigma factor
VTDPAQAVLEARHQVLWNTHLRRLLVVRQDALRAALSRNIVLQSDGQWNGRALRESLIESRISTGRLYYGPAPRSATGTEQFGRSVLTRRRYPPPIAGGAGEQLVCRVDGRNGHVVVRARGALTFDTTAPLAKALGQGLDRGHVIIDLRGVTEVDASGYRELENWHRRYREHGHFLVLAGPSARVHRWMRVLHLDQVISVFPTVTEAEEAVKEPVSADRPDQAAVEPVGFGFPGLLAPAAERIAVVGFFNGWDPTAHPMAKTAAGDWTVMVHLPPGRYVYNIWVDGVP